MLEIKQAIVVALGGALGSVARYKLGGYILHHTESWNFPASTFCVNLCGCFAIGVLAALAEHHDLFSMSARSFLFTGVLGGFTTFSAFGYETVFLLRRGMMNVAVAYTVLSVVCAVAGVLIGLKAVDLLWPPRH
jgi:fluoride exporter